MGLRRNLKDGRHVGGKGVLAAGKQPVYSSVTAFQDVTTSKYVDCRLMSALACDIGHSFGHLTTGIRRHGLSPGGLEREVMSRRRLLHAESIPPASFQGLVTRSPYGMRWPGSQQEVLLRVPLLLKVSGDWADESGKVF